MKKSSARIITTGIVIIIVAFAVWGWLTLSQRAPAGAGRPWGGVDVNVIEQYATNAGREAREPFINTDQGDMLLFVFALGGAVGGFVLGYFWRRLVSEKPERTKAAS